VLAIEHYNTKETAFVNENSSLFAVISEEPFYMIFEH